jgi:hypothetical protein
MENNLNFYPYSILQKCNKRQHTDMKNRLNYISFSFSEIRLVFFNFYSLFYNDDKIALCNITQTYVYLSC